MLEFIETWAVLGSKSLLQKYNLWVSSATVRNDMAKLEEMNLIFQPYNSAWRMPSTKWLRAFVDYLMTQTPEYFLDNNQEKNEISNMYDYTYNISSTLAEKTWEIAFFILPDNNLLQYSWVGTFLERNHKTKWDSIFSILKMLEDKYNFSNFIKDLPLNWEINLFIWDENIISFLQSYTIIIRKVKVANNTWYIWIIWWLNMNYSFNLSAIKWII